jgi:hypothetical protein
MSTTGWSRERAPSLTQRWRKAHHLSNVANAPAQLASWAHALPPAALGSTTPAEVQTLVAFAGKVPTIDWSRLHEAPF